MKKKWKTLKVMLTLAVVLSFLCIFTGCGNQGSDIPVSGTGSNSSISDGSVKVSAVSPTKLTTGTEMVIKGTGFGAARAISDGGTSFVTFEDTEVKDSSSDSSDGVTASNYIDWSDDEIHCLVPSLAIGKKYVVVVHKLSTSGTNNSSSSASDGNTLTVRAPGDPTAISSLNATAGGGAFALLGNAIVIKGSNFGAAPGTSYVMFGTVQQTESLEWSDSRIICNVPTNCPVGGVPIYVHTDDGGNSMPVTFSIYTSGTESPAITSLSSTSVTPGQSLTITGTNFGGTKGVRENSESFVIFTSLTAGGNSSIAALYTSWSDTSIILTVPTLTAGQYSATVFRSNGSYSGSSGASEAITVSTVTQVPTIEYISPSTMTGGGGNVAIGGSNFGSTQGTSYVMFGTTQVTAFTSWSDTYITCTVPGGLSGTVGVYVHTDTGGNSNTSNINVQSGPTVVVTSCTTSVTPGQTFYVAGAGFGSSRDSGQSTVSFVPQVTGGTTITATTYLTWSDTAITLITPSLITGVQYVVVVNRYTSSGTYCSSPTAISGVNTTVCAAPTAATAVTEQNPNPATAGASVTLIGTNFPTTGGYVLVNGAPVSATFTATSAVFPIPPGTVTGATVTLGGGTGGSTTYSLVIGSPTIPAITAITPNPAAPGSTIIITGANFGTTMGSVSMAIPPFPIATWSATSIIFTLPSTTAAGTYTVTVTTSGGQTATTSLTVSAPTMPAITSITPSSAETGAAVAIAGTNFGTTMGRGSVMFGTTSATVTSWSANSITCNVPSIAAGSYTITVNTSGGSSATAAFTVTSGGGGSSGKMYGLFVGINAYPTSPLNWCVNDVTGMQANLTSSAYWSCASITTLTDAQATKSAIQNAISNIASQMSASDTFFFYYSGHGSNSGSASYIVPVDNNGYTTSCISDSEMQSWLSAINSSSKKCVIFDTCYSGGFVDKGTTPKFIKLKNSNPLSIRDGFARHLQTLSNMVFLAASKGTETSAESSSLKHGIFTYWLMFGLGSGSTIGIADSNKNGKISAEEAFAKASPLTTSYYSSQHPQVQDNCTGDLDIKANTAYPQPTPLVTSISPASTTAGSATAITITGSNLGTAGGTVTIGTTAVTYVSWTSTSIVCSVPATLAADVYTVTVTPTGCTAATISFTVTSGGGGGGTAKIYALFVGINAYPSSPLNYCVNDVDGMKANLIQSALWSGASVTTLTDAQATKSGIQTAIATIAGQATPIDTFFFCYSGHGSNSGGVAYIVPVDNNGYTSSCISATELNTWVSAINTSAKKVIAFDSCYSGGFVGKGCTSKFMPLKNSEQVFTGKSFAKQMETISNLVFLAACSGSETSVETSALQHGIFMYYLMQGLGTDAALGPAASGGSVSAMGLFNYASPLTTTYYDSQHPQSQNNYSGDLPVKQ